MGMPPPRLSVKEDSTIIINTMPLAPSRAEFGKKMNCTSPVTSAVAAMNHTIFFQPYFSSSGGPTSSRSSILLM